MKLIACYLNVENANGRIYTADCFTNNLPSQIVIETPEANVIPENFDVSLERIVGTAPSIEIEGDKVVINAEIFDEKYKNLVESGEMVIRPKGKAQVDNTTKILKDYNLISFVLTMRGEDSFKDVVDKEKLSYGK